MRKLVGNSSRKMEKEKERAFILVSNPRINFSHVNMIKKHATYCMWLERIYCRIDLKILFTTAQSVSVWTVMHPSFVNHVGITVNIQRQ